MAKLDYIVKKNGQEVLKSNHKYFAQVQLGMAICNVQLCYFMVFSTFNGTSKILEVPYDGQFIHELLFTCKHKYFEKMLPTACGKHDNI